MNNVFGRKTYLKDVKNCNNLTNIVCEKANECHSILNLFCPPYILYIIKGKDFLQIIIHFEVLITLRNVTDDLT